MSERDIHVKAAPVAVLAPDWPVGRTFVCQASLWRVKGFYMAATPSGKREAWWILGEQRHDESEHD